MLSNAEYNEYQDSDTILERLKHPRLLRVTVQYPVEADSFTRPASTSRGQQQQQQQQPPLQFVIAVRPTTVRIHLLRRPTSQNNVFPVPTPSLLPQSLVCESELKRSGFTIALELIGDEWHPNVGRTILAPDPRFPNGQISARVTPHTTAMLNSFSRVEHFRLDSTEYNFMAPRVVRTAPNFCIMFSSVLVMTMCFSPFFVTRLMTRSFR